MSSQRKIYIPYRYYSVSTLDNWAKNSTNIYNINGGNVGVNTTTPQSQFDVSGQVVLRTSMFRIGEEAGAESQNTGSIAIGYQAGQCNQDLSAIAIGWQAGQFSQSYHAIAIGVQAGQSNQRAGAIATGVTAGQVNQGTNAIAIGFEAGQSNQGLGAIAIGYEAGQCNQGLAGLALGWQAGQVNQSSNAIAIGTQAGQCNQGSDAIAIGAQAGQCNQGSNSICIGQLSSSTFPNSIVLNATGTILNADASGLFVKSLDISTGVNNFLVYNTTSGRVSYNTQSTKTFIIEHPIENSKYLVHACMEGPEAGVYYRGQSEIKDNNSVEIILPPYTKKFSNFSIQLTPIGKYNKLSCREVCNNVFHVFGQNGKFYWTVFATRQEIETTVDKSSVSVNAQGPYTFLQ
jgi:hypothetical protein